MSILAAIVVVTNIGFTVGFDTDRNLPVWAAYDLAPSNIVKASRASIPFKADSRAGRDMNAYYRGSGLDRGHLVPAADMNWNTNALRQTYLFTNVCPMSPSLNRGEWRETEDEVRRLAASSTVHVVIVPVYWYRPVPGHVYVPDEFVKIAYGDFGARYWHCTQSQPDGCYGVSGDKCDIGKRGK